MPFVAAFFNFVSFTPHARLAGNSLHLIGNKSTRKTQLMLKCSRLKNTLAVLGILLLSLFATTSRASDVQLWSNPNITSDEISRYNHISDGSGYYFLSTSDTFMIDLVSLLQSGNPAGELKFTIADEVFTPSLPGPFLITGLDHNEWTVNVKMEDAAGTNLLPPHQPKKYSFKVLQDEPLFTNDAVVLGLLFLLLGVIFYTSSSKNAGMQRFYKIIPMLLLCYFLPSLLTTFGIVSGEISNLYFVASRYFLPASLVLLTLSIDLKEVFKLGPKALIMFGTATVGVVLGGPLAIMITSSFAPEIVGGAGPAEVWRGLATVAGSWIGGGANQAAMFEIYKPSESLYSVMITVDIVVAEIWMFFLLLGVGKSKELDKWFKADSTSINTLRDKMESFSLSIAKIPTTTNIMVIVGVCLAAVGLSHFLADNLSPFFKSIDGRLGELIDYMSLGSHFFWLIVSATAIGLVLSFTKARGLEGAGASKIGTIFIYFLVATIGMKMDITAVADHPGLFMVGGIWMAFHVGLLVLVGKLIRAPFFFLAVGSKANIGGAASAPVVAGAFHPSLAPVGVLLAVFGYAIGTIAAWFCGGLMQAVSP